MILIVILTAFLELTINLTSNQGTYQHYLSLNSTTEAVKLYRKNNVMFIDYTVNTNLSTYFNITQNDTYIWNFSEFSVNDDITVIKTAPLFIPPGTKLNYEYIALMLIGLAILLKSPDMFKHVRQRLTHAI